jgi:hypothetical protein
LFRRATVDQWIALEEEHAALPPPTGRQRAEVAGVYLLACLALWASQDLHRPTWLLVRNLEIIPLEHLRLAKRLWWAWWVIGCYCIPTGLYARYVMGMSWADLGLRTEGLLRHAWVYLVGFAIVLPLVFVVAGTPEFQETYPFFRESGNDLVPTLVWEVSYALQFGALEFFFRGFLLFAAFRVVGPWAIFAMMLPYLAIHFPKPPLEALASILAGGALGLVALRTRSILFGVVIHVGVAWTMDALAVWYRFHP